MPIYEYRREDGTTFDVRQSFSDEPLTVDPETGQAVQRVLSAPAIHFKGSGFHNTDYGTAKRRREKEAQKASESGSSSSSSDGGTSSSSSSDGGSKSDGGSSSKSDGAAKSGGSDSTPKAAA